MQKEEQRVPSPVVLVPVLPLPPTRTFLSFFLLGYRMTSG